MSALPLKADMLSVSIDVKVPQADVVCWWRKLPRESVVRPNNSARLSTGCRRDGEFNENPTGLGQFPQRPADGRKVSGQHPCH